LPAKLDAYPEAVARALRKRLYIVKYSEMESMWVGQTGKNIAGVFKEAKRQNAVLFFDEADAIASRRLGDIYTSTDRYANQTVNVLLSELEEYDGV
ncbi:MAG: ATP-binding protein, partial [Chloroflexota bacterium]